MGRDEQHSVDPVSPQLDKSKEGDRVFAWIFTLLPGVMAIWLSYICVGSFSKISASNQWIETRCRVIQSELGVDDEQRKVIDIRYSYAFNHQNYVGDKYDLGDKATAPRLWKQRVVNRHAVGCETVCFINPQDPSQAVLEPGWTTNVVNSESIFFLWCGLSWVGFICLVVRLRQVHFEDDTKPEDQGWEPHLALSSQDSGSGVGLLPLRPERPKFQETLRRAILYGPVRGLGVAACVILFAFVFESGELLLLALIFFLGLLCDMWKMGYCGLKVALWRFCPRPKIRTNTATPNVNGPLEVEWSLTGGLPTVRSMRIVLKGREQTEVEKRKRSKILRETFAEIVIVNTANPFEMTGGRQKVVIPAGTVPSMEFRKSRIAWSIDVELDVAWWPNPVASFPICVLPAACKELAA